MSPYSKRFDPSENAFPSLGERCVERELDAAWTVLIAAGCLAAKPRGSFRWQGNPLSSSIGGRRRAHPKKQRPPVGPLRKAPLDFHNDQDKLLQ